MGRVQGPTRTARRGGGTVPPGRAPDGAFAVTARVEAGVGVVALSGPFTGPALAHCRAGMDRVLRARPTDIVLDLSAAGVATVPVGLLGLARRYLARRGARLWLAGVPEPLLAELRERNVLDLYPVQPSVAHAVEVAVARRRLPWADAAARPAAQPACSTPSSAAP